MNKQSLLLPRIVSALVTLWVVIVTASNTTAALWILFDRWDEKDGMELILSHLLVYLMLVLAVTLFFSSVYWGAKRLWGAEAQRDETEDPGCPWLGGIVALMWICILHAVLMPSWVNFLSDQPNGYWGILVYPLLIGPLFVPFTMIHFSLRRVGLVFPNDYIGSIASIVGFTPSLVIFPRFDSATPPEWVVAACAGIGVILALLVWRAGTHIFSKQTNKATA